MKTFKYLVGTAVAMLVLFGSTNLIQAEGLRHLVWQTPGTNLTAIAGNDSTTSVIVVGSTLASHVRTIATVSNTNSGSTAAIGVKIGGLYSTTATFDVLVPPSGSHTFLFGEGYNGTLAIRSTNNTALTFIYWEGGY